MASLDGGLDGVVGRALQALGRRREVVAAVPCFLAAVAEADALVTLPARLARAFAPRFGLAVHASPVALRPFPVSTPVAAAIGPGTAAHQLLTDVLPGATAETPG